MLSNSGLLQVLETPPVEWDALTGELRANTNLQETVRQLEGVAERAARLARYLDMREGGGCGDQGHEKAVKVQNRIGRVVHEKAFGYCATHNINF